MRYVRRHKRKACPSAIGRRRSERSWGRKADRIASTSKPRHFAQVPRHRPEPLSLSAPLTRLRRPPPHCRRAPLPPPPKPPPLGTPRATPRRPRLPPSHSTTHHPHTT